KLLSRSDLVSPEQLIELREERDSTNDSLQTIIIRNKIADERTLAQAFAEYANIPFIELDPKDIPKETLTRIPERIARQYNAILFKIDKDGTAHLAMDDPDDVQAVSFIQKEVGDNIKLYLATHDNIQ